ncbi:MAG: redox-regulated ATPase YchF [Candidatus Woesearchaeota archaeon]
MLIGVVGKPNCGKSTFFKALTLADVLIANYPFATIKPNHGAGHAKVDCADTDFGVQCNPREGFCINHNRFVPVELIDVAGLVPGAHEGKGLGNQFLDDLRQADALIHVIDCSGGTNERGEVVASGTNDPANDIRFLETELDMWYLGILNKTWEKFAKQVQYEHKEPYKEIAKQFSGLRVTESLAKETIAKLGLNSADTTKWSPEDLKKFAIELRIATKPMLIAANKIDVPGAKENFERLKGEFPNYIIVACSAESEVALKEANRKGLISYMPGEGDFKIINEQAMNDRQKMALEFIRKNVLEKFGSTGVQDAINTAVFKLLNYIAVFPVAIKLADQYGRILPDCFLVPHGTTALSFAFRVHSDIGNGFIRAIDVKRKLTVGKDYPLKHRDVVEIISSK